MKVKIGIGVGVVVIVAALVLCFAPLKEVGYTVVADYQDTETYYEDEPYQDTETYYETELLACEVVEAFAQVEGTTPVVYVTLQNRDSVSGTFTVQFTLSESGSTITKSSMYFWSIDHPYEGLLNLQPDEIETIKCSGDGIDIINNDWDWSYSITPGTKTVEKERTVTLYRQVRMERTVTKYRPVEKERSVTKYRLVEKERTVTKQRPETRFKKVSLLEYLRCY